jgi:anaerobic magnesium-protoporphyrin IX monomethyl ester cyclase
MDKNKDLDCLFLIAQSSSKTYQKLSITYSAIEPPTWALLLAQSTRSVGFKVNILDANAENLSENEILNRIKKFLPKMICLVVYGQNVNAGTTNMSGAIHLSEYLKKNVNLPISIIGSHVQALPLETLKKEKSIDFVFTNEGVYALRNILKISNYSSESLSKIKGIAYRSKDKIIMNDPEVIVPNDKMDEDLPGYAWDMLPYKKTPLDLYRAPMWHAEYDFKKRTPYASLQTSLGCQFGCNFCMINIINRNDNDEVGVASNYSKMRFWSTDFIIKEFDKLIDMGVKTIRIVDEMFLLNPKYYIPLCEQLAERNKDDSLRIWSYSRIDTIKRPEILKLVRKAGIKWLALGIESGDRSVRLEVDKGKFEDVDVQKVIQKVHDADINVMANYIYGLPGDTEETIKKTFDLSLELCTAGWNTYGAMALPGSFLYKKALDEGIKLPGTYEGYSFHSYDTLPLPTEKLSAKEVITLRDEAFDKYHNHKPFLNLIKKKFGNEAAENIVEMTKIKLKRKIKGD